MRDNISCNEDTLRLIPKALIPCYVGEFEEIVRKRKLLLHCVYYPWFWAILCIHLLYRKGNKELQIDLQVILIDSS